MYKLVAIDLDGTMLNSYGIVTQNTKEKIKKVIQKGTKVVIASGRPIDSIKAIAEEIGSKEYFIGGNGAIIYDIKKDEIIYEKFLNKQKVLEIIDLCEGLPLTFLQTRCPRSRPAVLSSPALPWSGSGGKDFL